MNIKQKPVILRPREKLEKLGEENLSLAELLAIIISSGRKGRNAVELSSDLLKQFGPNLSKIKISHIASIKGIGKAKAIKIKAALELGYRLQSSYSAIILDKTEDIYFLLQEYINKKQEHLILLNLNARNELISKEIITIGTLNESLFHPREIFIKSIAKRASKIIIVHNHPSGSLEPSESDIIMTQNIKLAGDILGIELVDSLIISKDGYDSIIKCI